VSDPSPADRASAGPSKNLGIVGAIKDAFRKVACVVVRTGGEAPTPKVRKKRRGGEDARDAIPVAARIVARRTARQQYVAASIFLSETLDWLYLWQHDPTTTGNPAGTFDTVPNFLSPHL